MSLLGLDLSTSGCKCVVFNEQGETLSQAYKDYPELYPRPGWVEMDPEVVWKAVKEVIGRSVSQVQGDPVKALCISSLGVAVTPLDKNGVPLYNSLTAVDGRSAPQAEVLEKKLGRERIFQETGSVVSAAWSINKIMWLKENEPAVFKNAREFVLYEDFVMKKLGLEPTISHSLAGLTMAFDSRNRKWSGLILDAAGVDEALLSRPLPSGEIVGTIADSVADELGLPRGVKAVTGGFDQAMSALGGGLVESGNSTLCFGTIECLTTAFDEFQTNPKLLEYNHPIYCHVVKDLYITIAWCFTAGALLKWYRDTFAHEEKQRAARENLDVYDIIVGESLDEPARALVLPHFIGSGTPWLDPRSKGAFVGLTLATSRSEVVRAILDSLSYETLWNIETLQMAGIQVDAMNMFGGGAKSDKLLQIKSDIFEREVRALSISETGCLAAAILAGSAVGVYKNPREAVDVVITPRKSFSPDTGHREVYRKTYGIYKDLYQSLQGINHRLSAL